MESIKSIFEEYLNQIGELNPVQLGDEGKKTITQENSDFLRSKIQSQINVTNIILILAVILLCSIFLLSAFLAIYNAGDAGALSIIFGGSIISLLAIVRWLHRLWNDKTYMDLTIYSIQNMSPNKASEHIALMYWNIKSKKKG